MIETCLMCYGKGKQTIRTHFLGFLVKRRSVCFFCRGRGVVERFSGQRKGKDGKYLSKYGTRAEMPEEMK
jgi:DnaJ-class molecular chaperone